MSLIEIMLERTMQADGTLLLHEKPDLPPGRVTVVLRQETVVAIPKDDPFWLRMQAIWDSQDASKHVPRTIEQIEADQREMRRRWSAKQNGVERTQEELQAYRVGGEATS
jgi:predicted GNAT superfamily acetyltransferase